MEPWNVGTVWVSSFVAAVTGGNTQGQQDTLQSES